MLCFFFFLTTCKNKKQILNWSQHLYLCKTLNHQPFADSRAINIQSLKSFTSICLGESSLKQWPRRDHAQTQLQQISSEREWPSPDPCSITAPHSFAMPKIEGPPAKANYLEHNHPCGRCGPAEETKASPKAGTGTTR